MLTTVTSTALLQGLRQPDNDEAWRQFRVRYEPALHAVARRAGLQEEDACDVVQETFLIFVKRFRGGDYDRARGRLRSWLRGIILNKIREARRRLARPEIQVPDKTDATAFMNGIRDPDNDELGDTFEQEWERAVMVQCLEEIRRQVDEQTYEAFKMYALENRSALEVAEQLKISRNAVYISKNRVLKRLRQCREKMIEIW
jgi:RNA polymerase sigma factor (sigma-70 family)